jgi:hypothetical protein
MSLFSTSKAFEYHSRIEDFDERQAERDSIISVQEDAITFLRQERDSAFVVRDSLVVELDSSLSRIERLTQPSVTEEDKTEALSWIEEHNASLQE